ncbi:hypothetical protein SZ66_21815 [Pantoea ananatis]|nr:hypothetical protein [Pantoea ananatis]
MDTPLSKVMVLKLFQTETTTGTVTMPANVITPDIIKYRRPHYFPTDRAFTMDAFHADIIVTTAFRVNTSAQIMPFQ